MKTHLLRLTLPAILWGMSAFGYAQATLDLQQQDGFYLIGSGSDLVKFAQAVNGGLADINGRLTSNIDMTDASADFVPIGTSEVPFTGNFQGGDYRISHLAITLNEQDGVGMFGVIAPPATIEHFTLGTSCSINGNSYVGLVGMTPEGKTGDIRLNYLGNEGGVNAAGRNASGILGCCYASSATINMDHCYVTGSVVGSEESACLAGWVGTGAQVSNCWAIAYLQGWDNTGDYLTRPSYIGVSYTNCWAVDDDNPSIDRGSQVTAFARGEVATGELTWKMNGRSYLNPVWYQTVGEDSYPSWLDTHGVVYQNSDGGYQDVHDAESFAEFSDQTLTDQLTYAAEVVAQATLKAAYTEQLNPLKSITSMTEFAQAYGALADLQGKLAASAEAYAAYQAEIDADKAYLEQNPMTGEQAEILSTYLYGEEEPDEDFPNGTYEYVISHLLLDVAGINAETTFARSLLDKAIAGQISVNTDVTGLLANADFSDGLNGWDYTSDGGSLTAGGNSAMQVVTAYNNIMDMHQTIQDIPNGIYELQLNGAFRAGGSFTSTNYAAFAYTNGNAIPVPAENEGASEQKLNTAEDCAAAFTDGQYAESILCQVEDGKLTVGVENRNTYLEGDWLSFGGIHLYYRGTADQATEALDRTLSSLTARAQTQLSYEPAVDDSYSENPNYSAQYRTRLQDDIAQVASATTGDQKLALIQDLSETLQLIYECKIAYRNMVDIAEYFQGNAFEMKNNGQCTLEDIQAARVEELYNEIWNAYRDGTYSVQEAQEMAILQGNRFYLALNTVQDGSRLHPYLLSTVGDMTSMRDHMTIGQITYFRMMNDIDMSSVTYWLPLNNDWDNRQKNGETLGWQNFINFDGQNHVIRNFSCNTNDYSSFFGVFCGTLRNTGFEDVNVISYSTGGGALGGYIGHTHFQDAQGNQQITTIENVYITGRVEVVNSYCGGLGGNIGGPTVIRNVYTNLNVVSTAAYIGGLIGRVRDQLTVDNVYVAGTSDGHGIVGGGQKSSTPASRYTNVVVWNNSSSDFGATGENDVLESISYYNGSNQSDLQQTVVGWGSPWYCDMKPESYPTFNWNQEADGIQPVNQQPVHTSAQGIYDLGGRRLNERQEDLPRGLYIINGQRVLIRK